ncbi:DUF1203 domain-containing protein [Sagittula sp. NFXS13]|uniref:DUF1203 domain-containing protein n=1 Tax=Sagittula sp. NFXS13 TaxID=2819095 RepID=UPI0032E046FF
MSFQIHALPAEPFHQLFAMSDEKLRALNARRMTVGAKPGSPCRVSLADAEVGETVILVHYEHQPAASPYRAGHAIFVREGVAQARLAVDEVPEVLRSRLISSRQFDEEGMMIGADVVDGESLSAAIDTAFANARTSYIHLHNAKPGCFAARVTRA